MSDARVRRRIRRQDIEIVRLQSLSHSVAARTPRPLGLPVSSLQATISGILVKVSIR